VGNQDVTDDIPLTLTVSNGGYSMIDGSKEITNGLKAGQSATIEYNWDTGNAPSGDYNIQVAHSYQDDNPDNNSKTVTINVKEPSTGLLIGSIDPNSMKAGTSVPVIISGSGFKYGVKVAFENGTGPAPTASITKESATEIEATVTAKIGGPKVNRVWDVRVTNPDGQSVFLTGDFTVTP